MSEIKDNCMLCETADIEQAEKLNWIKELKLDGDRTLFIKGRLINRRGYDVTKRYEHIKISNDVVTDGEIVVFTDDLRTDFDMVRTKEHYNKAVYVIFDILKFNGKKLLNKPLIERREYLKKIKGKNIKTILDIKIPSWEEIVKRNLEGLIFKNPKSIYEFKRNKNWLKVKNEKIEIQKVVDVRQTENNAIVIFVENKGFPQKIVVNGKEKYNIKIGDFVKVKFLERLQSGKLRQAVFGGIENG